MERAAVGPPVTAEALDAVRDRARELFRRIDSPDQSTSEWAKCELELLYYPDLRPSPVWGSDYRSIEAAKDRWVRGSGLVALLLEAVHADAPLAREFAAHKLGFLSEPAAFDPLIRALRASEPVVRRAAAFALQYYRDVRAVPPLLDLLDDPDTEAAETAARALGTIGDPAAVAPLLEWCGSRDWRRRKAGYYALAGIDDPRCRDAAESGLSDPKPQVRKAAQAVLATIYWRRRR